MNKGPREKCRPSSVLELPGLNAPLLAVAGSFHSFVGDGLGLLQRFFDALLTSVSCGEFLADFGGDTSELRDRRELDTNIRNRVHSWIVGVS